MNFHISGSSFNNKGNPGGLIQQAMCAIDKNRICISLFLFSAMIQFSWCVSDKVNDQSVLQFYQQTMADQGPQQRVDTEGRNPNQPLGLLKPIASPTVITDPNKNQKTVLALGVAPPGLLKNEAIVAILSDINIVTDSNTNKKLFL